MPSCPFSPNMLSPLATESAAIFAALAFIRWFVGWHLLGGGVVMPILNSMQLLNERATMQIATTPSAPPVIFASVVHLLVFIFF